MFYAASVNPAYYEEKVSLFIALGPITHLANVESSLFKFFTSNNQLILETSKLLGIYEYFPANFLTTGAMTALCGVFPDICKFDTSLIFDGDPSVIDTERMKVYSGHFPAGASLYCLEHFS